MEVSSSNKALIKNRLTCIDKVPTGCLIYGKKTHLWAGIYSFFYTSEAIWRDRRLPDWWKQPDCGNHLQVESWGRTGTFSLIHTCSILTFITTVYKNTHFTQLQICISNTILLNVCFPHYLKGGCLRCEVQKPDFMPGMEQGDSQPSRRWWGRAREGWGL